MCWAWARLQAELCCESDDRVKEGSPVVVLSYDYWKTKVWVFERRGQSDVADQWASVRDCGRGGTGFQQCDQRVQAKGFSADDDAIAGDSGGG